MRSGYRWAGVSFVVILVFSFTFSCLCNLDYTSLSLYVMDIVCIFHIFVVLIKTSSALLFTSPISSYHRQPHESTLLRYYNENTDIDNTSIGRRQLLHGILLYPVFKSIDAYANGSVVTKAICDTTTIESYQKGMKEIHLVGTAHISSESSRLSRDVVREIKVKLCEYEKKSMLL